MPPNGFRQPERSAKNTSRPDRVYSFGSSKRFFKLGSIVLILLRIVSTRVIISAISRFSRSSSGSSIIYVLPFARGLRQRCEGLYGCPATYSMGFTSTFRIQFSARVEPVNIKIIKVIIVVTVVDVRGCRAAGHGAIPGFCLLIFEPQTF